MEIRMEHVLHNRLGVGGGEFPVRFSEYQTSYFKDLVGRQAHSFMVYFDPELGILESQFMHASYVNIKHIFG